MGPESDLERAGRLERAQIVAALARRLGDLELAEDAVQEAFARAVTRWPRDGVPERPGAWLTTVAWRHALDALRRRRPIADLEAPELVAPEVEPGRLEVDDDVLGLVLACCHPALALETQVALTLRHVAGLTVAEIAAAFLVEEEAMAKRLVRARVKLRTAGVRLEAPEAEALPERLAGAQAVVYLVFTEGHTASGGDAPVRTDLCREAIWLAEQLHVLAPEDAETTGLLALLLLTHARSAARVDADGRLVPFAEQDRARWDDAAMARARTLLAATGAVPPGPYQLQAAIAALHAAATPDGEPDWTRIARLHDALARVAPSPVAEVNRAMAVGRSRGPQAGLAVLEPLLGAGTLARYAPLHAVHAELLAARGDAAGAQAAWSRAAGLARTDGQREGLRRLAARGMSSPSALGRR